MAHPKRRLTSSQASSQSSVTSSANPPPAKRIRREEPILDQSTSREEPTPAPAAPAAPPEHTGASKVPLPEAKKRVLHPGTLRRLSTGHPSSSSISAKEQQQQQKKGKEHTTREKQTLSGNRIGGKSKDLKDGVNLEEIWVHSKGAKQKGSGSARGMGFSAWLKRGVGAFVERGCTCLKIHGMAATIPTALTLALAIRDAVPGGSPIDHASSSSDQDVSDSESDGGEYDPEQGNSESKGKSKEVETESGGIFTMEVRTGTTIVGDEITPEDDNEDIIYQTRSKSTVEITLKLDEELGKLVGIGKKFQQRGGGGTRGGKRRGAGARGGGRGRGRGRGQ